MVRLKHRWLVFQIIHETSTMVQEISNQDIQNSIREKVQTLFGDVGMG